MFPILQIGPLAIQTPGLIIILGLWLGLSLAEFLAPRFNIESKFLYNLVFTAMVAGVIGARLFFVIRYFNIFWDSPLNLFSPNPGLLDPIGGAASSLVAGLIFVVRKQMDPWFTLDGLTPLVAVVMIAIGFAQLASGNAFGIETDLPWGIQLWGLKRHPTQIYNILSGIIILGFIRPTANKPNGPTPLPGSTFLRFTALTAGGQLFLETFRVGHGTIMGNIRITQVTAWVVLALSLWGLLKLKENLSKNIGGSEDE